LTQTRVAYDDDVADDVLYNWNRAERKVARQDAPLARVVQTEEEKRQQQEALKHLESLKKRLFVVSMRELHLLTYMMGGRIAL